MVDLQALFSPATWQKQSFYRNSRKKPREDSVDATIDALYKSKNMKPPDKVKEAATYVAPLT